MGYEYDALGRMVKVTGRDGGETVYEYDAQGSVTKVARADGSATTAEYDLAGRVVRLTNCDASGAVVSEFSYTYDATGYIATETVTQGERSTGRSYTYTQRGELATATENGQTVAYTYDGAGNRIKEEGPNGTTVFVYDEADRLQSTGGASVTAYTWDADGNMTSMESGEGVYEYIYDTESRLLAVREGGSLLMSVLYDGLGDRSYGLEFKMIDRHLNKFPHLPGYWNNGHWNCIPDAPEGPKNPKQASAAAENTPAEAEEGTGFWQGVVDWFTGLFGGEDEASGEASTYGVGNANGDYTNNGGADNDHGGNGNTNNGNGKPGNNGNGSGNNGNGNNEGDGGAISDWAVKKLKKLGFTDMDIEMLERLGVTDADARQIIETAKVPNTGNGPTHFIPAYDLMYYVNDVNRENTEVLTLGSRYNSDTAFVYGQQRLYADHEGESETYLYDGRGSVVQLLKDGAVTQEYAYDAYGYINADEFGIQAPFYGYNGEEQNPFTGLQYLRARYYAPQNGGFITQDSFSGVLTNALSQNRYAYAHNNPVNYADPSGHFAISGGTALLVLGGTLLVTAITTVVAMVTSSVSTTRKSNTSRFTYTPSPKPPILTFPAPAPQVPMAETFPAPSPQLPTILKSPSPVVAGAIILTILTQPQTKKLNLLPTPMEEATDRSIYFSRRYSCDVSSTDPHIAAQGPVSSVESAAEFERRISSLSPSERVAAVKEKAAQVAEQNGWKKDSKVMSKNPGRTIYYDRAADEYYSVDTQHGRLERENWRGKHLGEVDMDLNPIPDSVDPSGKHDINV